MNRNTTRRLGLFNGCWLSAALVAAPLVPLQQASANDGTGDSAPPVEFVDFLGQFWHGAFGVEYVPLESIVELSDVDTLKLYEKPQGEFVEYDPDHPLRTARWEVVEAWSLLDAKPKQEDPHLRRADLAVGLVTNEETTWTSWVTAYIQESDGASTRSEIAGTPVWVPVALCDSEQKARAEADLLARWLVEGRDHLPEPVESCRDEEPPDRAAAADGSDPDCCGAYGDRVRGCWLLLAGEWAACTGVYAACLGGCMPGSLICAGGGPEAVYLCYTLCALGCVAVVATCLAGFYFLMLKCRRDALAALKECTGDWSSCFPTGPAGSRQRLLRELSDDPTLPVRLRFFFRDFRESHR